MRRCAYLVYNTVKHGLAFCGTACRASAVILCGEAENGCANNKTNMIEVFDAKRTRSYGCFASFKAATDTLDSLAATGQLGSVPAVSVAAYCSGVLQREYEAVFVGGKWRVPKSPKRRMPETRPARGRRRRKWCKEYATAELVFREGFPDHLNRSYPLSADSLRRCNRKCRIYMQ